MPDIMTVNRLNKQFGSLKAVDNLSFDVKEGEILGLMGPNGAGKTTVFNLITGVFKPELGEVMFKGRNVTKDSPAKRCHRGIGRTYQIPRPFNKMTVFENLLVAAVHGGKIKEKPARKKVDEILNLIGMYDQKSRLAGTLPLLNRKSLELGRALATQPSLILLDEIAGGLTEKEAELVLNIVKTVNEQGITIIWIEHILSMMSEGANRLLLIAEGRQIKSGNPGEVLNSDEILECYLGVEEE